MDPKPIPITLEGDSYYSILFYMKLQSVFKVDLLPGVAILPFIEAFDQIASGMNRKMFPNEWISATLSVESGNPEA